MSKESIRAGVTKRDLQEAIKSLRHYESEATRKLQEASKKAAADLEKFESTNERYRQLAKASDKAVKAMYDSRNREKEVLDAELEKVSLLLKIKGPTEEVAEMIEALLKKYPSYKGYR